MVFMHRCDPMASLETQRVLHAIPEIVMILCQYYTVLPYYKFLARCNLTALQDTVVIAWHDYT